MPRLLQTLLDVPAAGRRPMTKDESELFIRIVFAQANGEAVCSAEALRRMVAEERSPLVVRIIVGRLSLASESLRYHETTVLFLASLSKNPAHAVMWAHYLVTRTASLGCPISTAELSRDFPFGFPTDDAASVIWDAQKVRLGDPASGDDNCLDAEWPWRSSPEQAAA